MDNHESIRLTPEQRAESTLEYKAAGNNCCQAVLLAFKDLLPYEEEELRSMGAAFGTGMAAMEATCGALIGAQMILGMLKFKDGPVRADAKDIYLDFEKRTKATICKDIKGRDTGIMLTSCPDCMRNAVYCLTDKGIG